MCHLQKVKEIVSALFNCLSKMLKKAGSLSAATYGFSFIVLIFVFAYIYTTLSKGFYHSSIQFEEAYLKESYNVPKAIFKQINDAFISKYIPAQTGNKTEDWIPDIRSTNAQGPIVIEGNELTIKGYIFATKSEVGRNETIYQQMNMEFIFKFNPEVVRRHNLLPLHKGNKIVGVGLKVSKGPFLYREDQSKRMTASIPKYDLTAIKVFKGILLDQNQIETGKPYNPVGANMKKLIAGPIHERLLAFWDASNGRPAEFKDSYLRMLYFSAVTITTLGYGDIIPITTAARSWIALESILGLLLMGLFLNAVTRKPARPK